jgi:hypothetical protein
MGFQTRGRKFQRLVKRVELLSLQPGDALVVQSMRRLTMHEMEQIRHGLKQTFPGRRCIITDPGLSVRVVRGLGVK